ncbi:MAG TPA: hypothetical protein VG755_33895 [Nannocystaceae bacterium]|nr:hypothetical protein [Nannocystaceae bacterium]
MQPQQVPYPQQGYPQQGYPQSAVVTAAPAGAQYEFGEAENRTITKTYTRARAWGVISVLLGALQVWMGLSAGYIPGIIAAIGGVVNVVVGVVLLGAAAGFERVVKSRGNDVTHMMAALDRLALAFGISIGVAVLAFCGGAVLGAIGAM